MAIHPIDLQNLILRADQENREQGIKQHDAIQKQAQAAEESAARSVRNAERVTETDSNESGGPKPAKDDESPTGKNQQNTEDEQTEHRRKQVKDFHLGNTIDLRR